MSDEMVCLQIAEAKEKMRPLFPEDPRSDIIIIHKQESYKLQKVFLRLHSNYFKNRIGFNNNVIQIDYVGDQEIVKDVLSCFYGASIDIQRCDVIEYFPVVKLLQVESLQKILRNDMLMNGNHYDIFGMFSLAFQFNEHKLFQVCLQLLEKQNYEQMKENRKSLLKSSPQLFKHVIKCYNKSSQSHNINFYDVSNLIVEYCERNELGEEEARSYKFDLIDKNKLTSEQFKNIFIINQYDNTKMKKKKKISIEEPQSNFQDHSSGSFMNDIPNLKKDNVQELEMEELDECKLEQKKSNRDILMDQIKQIKQTYTNQLSKSQMIRTQFHTLRKNLTQKQAQQRNIGRMCKSIEVKLQEMQKKWLEKSEKLTNLVASVNSFESGEPIKKVEKENDQMLMSVVDDGTLFPKKLKEESIIRGTEAKKQKQKSLGSSNLDVKEIQFDRRSVAIRTKEQMKNFVHIICPEFFSTKNLNLIYRRSQKNQQYGDKKDIKGRSQLIFLVRTGSGKLVGGYLSQSIPYKPLDYLEDKSAYIFSITSGKKFNIKNSQKKEAIMLNEDYLICFGTDLMLSDKCLEEESYCSWPDKYEHNKEIKERGSEWLVGETQFSIQDLECYELENHEMEMIL